MKFGPVRKWNLQTAGSFLPRAVAAAQAGFPCPQEGAAAAAPPSSGLSPSPKPFGLRA